MPSDSELKALIYKLLAEKYTSTVDADTLFILYTGFLVFFMHAGFSMLEAGRVAMKNRVNILFKNVATLTFGGICYFLLGYGFAFGSRDHFNTFIGGSNFAGSGFMANNGALRKLFFFEFAFCVTSATITSGAMAGRVKLEGYILIACFLTSFVYPVVSHWAWSTTGWLSPFKTAVGATSDDYILSDRYPFACGAFDFAGSGVVHLTGGTAALICAAILGPRVERFSTKARSDTTGDIEPAQAPKRKKHRSRNVVLVHLPGHNLSIATLGTFILWFGWYGFSCGSALAFSGEIVGRVAVNTSLSPAAAGVVGLLFQKLRTGYYDLATTLNCILAGLVSVSTACAIIPMWSAMAIGCVGSLISIGAAELLLYYRVDDPIGAAPVHMFPGAWGVLAAGIFAKPEFVNIVYDCPNPVPVNPNADWLDVLPAYQFLQQFLLVVSIVAWVCLTMIPTVYALKRLDLLRSTDVDQIGGLDRSEHGINDPEHFGLTKPVIVDTQSSSDKSAAKDQSENIAPIDNLSKTTANGNTPSSGSPDTSAKNGKNSPNRKSIAFDANNQVQKNDEAVGSELELS